MTMPGVGQLRTVSEPTPKIETTERPPLSRAVIVEAAIAIADAEGIGKLSMRHLAHSLGYEVMSLYNHVANKDELISLMVDTVAAEIPEPSEADPMAAIRALATSTQSTFLRHPWVPDQWLRRLPGPERIRTMETLLRLLAESGLDPHLAHLGFHAVNNHVLGHTLQALEMAVGLEDPEATMQEFMGRLSDTAHPHTIAHVQQHVDGEDGNSFDLVLDLILDGLVGLDEQR